MTDLRITADAYSVQAAKPSQKYGQLATLPVKQAATGVMVRFSLAAVPKGATITSAVLTFKQGAAVTGSHNLKLHRATANWSSAVTWTDLPTFTTTGAVTVTKAAPAAGTAWGFDITSLVQSMVSGTTANLGFYLAKLEATQITLLGTTASSGQPILTVTYTLAPSTPSNLHPSSGAVSIAKPTLSFQADNDIIAMNVQIDPASNPGTAFDTGEIAATGGLLDLTTTAYAGLANAGTTTWRVRQKNSQGWSAWSSWATFSRTNKSAVTITSPSTGAITDGTPPTTWTFSGTQTAWQARLLDATGKVLADSGRQVGSSTTWTPTKGLTVNGQTGTLEVRVWDNVSREATPGDEIYAVATLAVTLTLSGAVTGIASLAATQDGVSPIVVLTGTRASIPDEVRVFVNGTQVASYVGTDVFTGTNMTIRDLSAPMNISATYRVAAVVNGVVASGGSTVVYTPRCTGIWLFDESDHDDGVAIWTDQDQEQNQPELSIVHKPISDGDADVQVVRRRLVRFPPEGSISGTIVDALTVDVDACEALLRAWAETDAGHLYRLILGNMNRTVIVGDLNFSETPQTSLSERIVDVDFNWWSQS